MRALSLVALTLASAPGAARAVTRVCVDVEVKSWAAEDAAPAPDDAVGSEIMPDYYAVDPALYLKRMVVYDVTHEVGFEAVETDCAERLTVELYPLPVGWTVFARFSGHAREEKVDAVQADELAALSQRLTRALLRDEAISDTITRENVLRADSERSLRTIDGKGHITLALGTQVRAGQLPTASDTRGPATDELRILTPLNLHLGYRGKFQTWGVDAFGRLALGTNERAVRRNEAGGHADFSGSGALGLHFLRYLDPTGMSSFYLGSGAAFELAAFSMIRPLDDRGGRDDREQLWGGGLNVDLLVGYEFMRASTLHFFVQLELHLPTYRFDTENDAGGVESWLPGGLAQIGIVF